VTPPAAALVLDWTVDPASLVLVAVAGALYLGGVRRLARAGRGWPPARTVSFLSGLAAVVVATSSGLATHDDRSFAAHAGQHALLGMAAPLLLALSAPITLAIQASSRPTGAVVRRMLDSRASRVLAHPVTGWSLFGGTLVVGLYSPLLELSLRNDLVHVAVHGLYMLAGSLFLWPLVGADPSPRRPPHAARVLFLFAAVPVHAFVGAALTTGDALLAPGWYGLEDQRVAGGITWVAGAMLGLVAGGVVVWQWMRYEERETARHDRRAGTA
jgi:putative membrane protein